MTPDHPHPPKKRRIHSSSVTYARAVIKVPGDCQSNAVIGPCSTDDHYRNKLGDRQRVIPETLEVKVLDDIPFEILVELISFFKGKIT